MDPYAGHNHRHVPGLVSFSDVNATQKEETDNDVFVAITDPHNCDLPKVMHRVCREPKDCVQQLWIVFSLQLCGYGSSFFVIELTNISNIAASVYVLPLLSSRIMKNR